MTSKERLMIALNKQVPDRMPATIHQWQPYHLKYYMNVMSDIQAFKAVGLDASVSYYLPCNWTCQDPEWQVNSEPVCSDDEYEIVLHTIKTPKGILTHKIGRNEKTTWVVEHMIKQKEDIEKLHYLPIPTLDKKDVCRVYDSVGDAGIVRSFVMGSQGGCWQDACRLYDMSDLLLQTFDDPRWVHEFLSILLARKLLFIEKSLTGAKFDLIETGGGAASSTVISPAVFEQFCLPYDQKIHKALHSAGFKVVYHTCGGMVGIIDQIIETETDASETLSPRSIGGNIDEANESEVYKKLHGKVAMIGGLDQFHILTSGTPEIIESEVQRLFRVFGQGGGYICSACDHFFDAPIENLISFAEAAKSCVY